MRKFLFATIAAFSLSHCIAQHYNEKYGQPIVVLIEADPWLMVIGSDVPTFALYEQGQIIYKKIVDKRIKYFEVTNSRANTQAIIKSLGITDSLLKQPDYIRASNSTDQPTNTLLLNFDTLKEISVYGALRDQDDARKRTSKYFLTVMDNIIALTNTSVAKEWLPDTVEVMVNDYSHSPEKPLPWNKNWPGINSPTTIKRGDDLYSIYLDKKYFTELQALLRTLREKQAVEIDGKKYAVNYRLPFPNLR